MPPNKDSKYPPLIGVYNVEEMNIEELKLYIVALKEETEQVKENLALQQREKSELVGLLQNSENEILTKLGNLIQKDVEMQEDIVASRISLKEEEKKNLAHEGELKEREARCLLESFIKIQDTKSQFKKEENNLRKNLEGIKRGVAERKLDHKCINLREEEKKEEHYWDLIQSDLEKISAVVEEVSRDYHKAKKIFFSDKICEMKNIWETLSEKVPIEVSISKYAEKMSLYFRDIFCQNIEEISILGNNVRELEKELNKLKLQIREAKRCNKAFLTGSSKKTATLKESADKNANSVKFNDSNVTEGNLKCNQVKLSDLFYENDVLKEKLKQVVKERDSLRKHFTSALRKIYNKADFKSFIFERIFASLQNKETRNSDFSSVYYAVLPKIQKERDMPEQ